MTERKLNFNAPLMSVRRIGSRPMSPNAGMVQTSPPPNRQTADRPPEPDLGLELVTEPVAVPFHWEQIPGRAKDGHQTNARPPKKLSPRTPPGKVYAVESNKYSKEATKERAGLEFEDDEEDDTYSDALDTLSSQESASLNCSASGVSGSDGGVFSTDPQTRDFMMKRFLPAAKAMAFEPPRNYAAKKQTAPAQDRPRQVVRRVSGEEKRPNMVVPKNGVFHKEEEEESGSEEEEEVEEYNEPKIITTRGCGLLPRLCFRNSLSLLGPLPGLKVGSPKPTSSSYNQSLSKSVKKAWDNHKKKSESGSFSSEQKVGGEKKKSDESMRFTFSGELIGRLSPFRNSRSADTDSTPKKKKPDIRSRSGELWVSENKGRAVESKRFAYSGELNRERLSPFRNTRPAETDSLAKNLKTDIGSRSAELKMIENKRVSDPRRLAYSGDLQRVMPPPFRSTRAASISPYHNQSSQSPFRRGAFLGLPKEENVTMPNLSSKVGNKFQEASGNQGWSFSSSPAVEKTLYVDTVHNADKSYSCSGYLGNKPRFLSGEQLRGPRWGDEEFSFQDIKSLNNALALEVLEQEISVSVDDRKTRHKQEVKSVTAKRDSNADIDQQEDLLGINSSLTQSPLPPPLLRSPSESWLWRIIPSVSLIDSFGLKSLTKDTESKTSSTGSTKWETIVKTSKWHHDHARYSEELLAHISKQSKT